MPNAFEGAARSDPRPTPVAVGVLLIQVIAAIAMVITAAAFLFWGIDHDTGPARRTQCMMHAMQLVAASLEYESIHGSLPLASSQPFSGRPGKSGLPDPAGYSWIVPILPYLGKDDVYDQWKKDSHDFQLGPFDPQNNERIPLRRITEFFCPSNDVYEVDTTESEYQEVNQPGGEKQAPARCAYITFAASHFTNSTGLGELYETDPQSPFDGNGLIPFPRTPSDAGRGITRTDIRDGRSYTFMLCESLEPAYAAWCDGQAMWAVGAWPGNQNVPGANESPDGLLGWPDSDQQSRISLSAGDDDDPALAYLPKSRYTARHDRRWGPGSNHHGGVATHVFADGHAEGISPDIDRNLYLRLISRDGGEPDFPSAYR